MLIMCAPPRLLDRLRAAIRTRHYSRRTEESYAGWTRRFILFHRKRHPASMGADEVNAFLTHLAVTQHVSASTQAQALSALVFLYRHVLEDPLPWLDDVVRASRPRRLPAVLMREEVAAVLALLGHADVKTTMIYTHVLQRAGGRGIRSPLDAIGRTGGTGEESR